MLLQRLGHYQIIAVYAAINENEENIQVVGASANWASH